MPMLTIKGMPDDLYLALKERAEQHHRSLNGEIIDCLERAVRTPALDVDRWLSRVRRLRSGNTLPQLTPAELARLKNRGRK